MGWIWIKLISGLIFVLVPGFTFKENFKKHPFLTVLSLSLGLFLLFLSLKPLVEAESSLTKIEAEVLNIKAKFEQELILKESTEKNNFFIKQKEKLLEEKRLAKEKEDEKIRLDQKKLEKAESQKKENLAKEQYKKERETTSSENSIASDLNIPASSVKPLLRIVIKTIRKIQDSIVKIADSTADYSLKKNTIKPTIKKYFLSQKVIVQSSSLNRSNIISRTVKDYFQHLLNLSSTENIKINISFGEELRVTSIWLNSKKEKIFEVSVDQIFEICKGKRCKSDVTKKTIQIKLKKDNIAVVAKIYVTDTYSLQKK